MQTGNQCSHCNITANVASAHRTMRLADTGRLVSIPELEAAQTTARNTQYQKKEHEQRGPSPHRGFVISSSYSASWPGRSMSPMTEMDQ